MTDKVFILAACLWLLLLCPLMAEAQEPGAGPEPSMAADSRRENLQSEKDTPDTRPLAGAQNLSLGSQSSSHSFLLPSFGVTSQVQTNAYNSSQTNRPSFISTTYLNGRLALNKVSGRSELLLDYLAAGGFSNDSYQENSLIQGLDLAETIHAGRWSHLFGDQLTYLPQSSFGFSGLGDFGVGLGNGLGSTPGFRQDLLPDQSIMTRAAQRISNTALVETTYALGYRSSLTFVGSYALQNFIGDLQNGSAVMSRGGYNYLLSPLNSISISYGFNRLMFGNLPFGVDDHIAQLSFGRRVTGRLSFQVGAGPDVQIYRAPIAGPTRVISWVASSAINYQVRHTRAGLGYNHSLGLGSGVLPGVEAHVISGQLGQTFAAWSASVSSGYAINHALRQTRMNATTISPQSWFATVNADRHFARHGSIFVGYGISGQSSLVAACSLLACRTNTLIQTVSIGYNWGFPRIVLK